MKQFCFYVVRFVALTYHESSDLLDWLMPRKLKVEVGALDRRLQRVTQYVARPLLSARWAEEHLLYSFVFAVFFLPLTGLAWIGLRFLSIWKRRALPSPTAAPGWRLLRVLSWIYSERTLGCVFLPTIRDMQHEHIQALAESRTRKAGWVLVRGYWSVGAAIVAQMPVSLARFVVQLWKAAN